MTREGGTPKLTSMKIATLAMNCIHHCRNSSNEEVIESLVNEAWTTFSLAAGECPKARCPLIPETTLNWFTQNFYLIVFIAFFVPLSAS